jgi:ComF family protein
LPRPELRCVFRRDPGSLTFDVPPSQTTRWRAVVRVLRSPVDAFGCALLPACCALCGSPLPHLSYVPICDACWAEFPVQSGSVCVRCGDALNGPVSPSSGKTLCRVCRLAPPPFERAVAYGPYRGCMKAAIHALKYDGLQPAARRMGRMLAEAIAQLSDEAPAEMLVVPIPLHRSKYAQRGFNQARSLAVYALDALRKSHPAWRLTLAPRTLMRLRATESQAGLTAHARRVNVRRAFSVSDQAIVDQKNVLIIDDIYTSGATTRAAARVLLRAGAASVWVATLARAVWSNPVRRGSEVFFEDAAADYGSSFHERLIHSSMSDKVSHPCAGGT